MAYRILADATLVLHLAFVVFVVAGGLLALWWKGAPWVHVPAAVYGLLIEWVGWTCPLTPLEGWLRQRGGEVGYAGGFVEHYLVNVLYPPGLTREAQWMLGGAVLVVNVGVYAFLSRRPR